MKNRIPVILVLLALGITGFIFNKSEPKDIQKDNISNLQPQQQQTNTGSRWLEKFYIGAVHDGIDCGSNYQNMIQLGFNIWHMYILASDPQNGKYYPRMDWPAGGCGDPIDNDGTLNAWTDYANGVNERIRNAVQQNPNIRVITMRPKIEYLCYGQRSDYQCEPVNVGDDLWFYSFNDHITGTAEPDNTIWGQGANVIHCRKNVDNAESVVKRLKANTEQCKRTTNTGNAWQYDSYCDWLIKPKIRIPFGYPENNRETPICSLKVIAADGNTVLLNVILKGKNFLDGNGSYNGDYIIDKYNFTPEPNMLTITGDWAAGANNKWQYKARGTCSNDDNAENRADIQVYWYGNCDMWIDYVRVDNDVANDLLKGLRDNWIQDEVEQIGMNTTYTDGPVFMKYYVELSEFNNIPCMAYVNSKLKEYSLGRIDLIQDLTNTLSAQVPWDKRSTVETANFYNNHYIQKVGFTQVFAESYPLTACYNVPSGSQLFSKVPSTLPSTNSGNILANIVSPDVYESYLQDNINHSPYTLEGYEEDIQCGPGATYQDRGNFRYKMQLCNALSKLADIPFIFMAQAHQWHRPEGVLFTGKRSI